MAAGDRQLLGRGVDADHRAALPHQLCEHVGVASRAGAQVEHPRAVERQGRDKAAAVIARQHLLVHLPQRPPELRRGRLGGGAGVGLQVARAREDLPVIVLHGGEPKARRTVHGGLPSAYEAGLSPSDEGVALNRSAGRKLTLSGCARSAAHTASDAEGSQAVA